MGRIDQTFNETISSSMIFNMRISVVQLLIFLCILNSFVTSNNSTNDVPIRTQQNNSVVPDFSDDGSDASSSPEVKPEYTTKSLIEKTTTITDITEPESESESEPESEPEGEPEKSQFPQDQLKNERKNQQNDEYLSKNTDRVSIEISSSVKCCMNIFTFYYVSAIVLVFNINLI